MRSPSPADPLVRIWPGRSRSRGIVDEELVGAFDGDELSEPEGSAEDSHEHGGHAPRRYLRERPVTKVLGRDGRRDHYRGTRNVVKAPVSDTPTETTGGPARQ